MDYQGEQETDAINAFLDEAYMSKAPRTVDVAEQVLDGKTARVITLRKEPPPLPLRLESPARAHTCFTLQGFADYVKKYGAANDIVVLCDPAAGTFTAVLDEKAAKGFERITFKPQVHPFWAAWKALLGKATWIADFATFLTANKHTLAVNNANDFIDPFRQICMSKKTDIQAGNGAKSMNGVMVETEIKGIQNKERVDLPERIPLNLPMFVGFPNMDIVVDMMIRTGKDEGSVMVVLTSSDAEAQALKAMTDMVGTLATELPRAVVTMGQVAYRDWEYSEKSSR